MSRLSGIDLARGLAVLGMIVAHVGADNAGAISRFFWLADGRPSALFAVLAGWGLHFITAAGNLRAARIRIALRAAVLVALGWLIELFLPTPVAVILIPYAFMFLAALPLLGLSVPRLLGCAALCFTIGPLLVFTTRHALDGVYEVGGQYVPVLHSLVTGYYPTVAWLGYLLVGLAAGRLFHRGSIKAHTLAGVGATVALAGYGCGLLLAHWGPAGSASDSLLAAFVSTQPHATSPFELIGNTGAGLAVIGLCLWACQSRAILWLSASVRAVGQMSLTAYVLHLVLIFLLLLVADYQSVIHPTSHVPLAQVGLPVIGFCWLWATTFGQGPLERGLALASGKKWVGR